jgi:hypothetical protein
VSCPLLEEGTSLSTSASLCAVFIYGNELTNDDTFFFMYSLVYGTILAYAATFNQVESEFD